MRVQLERIPLREALHFLGWRGTALDEGLVAQIRALIGEAVAVAEPRILMERFPFDADGTLRGTSFSPRGQDVQAMLSPCREAVLLAATLGASSERLLLRTQATDPAKAVILDAVLSAGIETLLDEQEASLRASLRLEGRFLTDRFSPGYGDMPLGQTREICEVLSAQRRVGLTVSARGIMIPRKSVTAIMGISDEPVQLRPRGCEGCMARECCALRRA